MAQAKAWTRIAGGVAVAIGAAGVLGVDGEALAKKRASGPTVMVVQTVNLRSRANVPANVVVDFYMSAAIAPSSVTPATVQIRRARADGYGYTRQAFGTFQAVGRVLRFYPRLPGHLRDTDGNFFPAGSAQDNAADNAGLQPASSYQITLVGRPSPTSLRSTRNRPLRRNYVLQFTTAPATDPAQLYTTLTYGDSAADFRTSLTNPPDTVPTAATKYLTHGGTKGVPNDLGAGVQIYCTRVPISPTSARVPGNVTLNLTERNGRTITPQRSIRGTVFVEQNFSSSIMVFRPTFALADLGQYVLKIQRDVRDLTEQYPFQSHRERTRLQAIYNWLVPQRTAEPTKDPGLFADPSEDLIPDWPPASDTAGRAELKRNILTLGDTYKDEIDPRTMLIFSTRDEAATPNYLDIDFTRSEDLYDAPLSTGDWDTTVSSAASAIFTASGGSGVLGDYKPTLAGGAVQNLPVPSAANPEFNFKDVVIPNGVTIRIQGATTPVTLKAINFQLDGILDVSGGNGGAYSGGSYGSQVNVTGGTGGPGGGAGATVAGDRLPPITAGSGSSSSLPNFSTAQITTTLRDTYSINNAGGVGNDTDGANPTPVGGRGGLGGRMSTGSYYVFAGAGGGGGARQPGAAGQDGSNGNATVLTYNWHGLGGAGGAQATVQDCVPLFGGAGGGAGGNGFNYYYAYYYSWYSQGGSGGGGGGAITIQVARTLTVSQTGAIRARGGTGGAGTLNYSTGGGGPGGGGGGGSILLKSTTGFNFFNPTQNLDVTGGAGGATTVSSYGTWLGGKGGDGFVKTMSPAGGVDTIAPHLKDSWDPVGGGVPSYVYSKWIDLGVEDPRMVAFSDPDNVIATQPMAKDAIVVEGQMTREDTAAYGTPNLTKVSPTPPYNSTDTSITSNWVPIKVHDLSGLSPSAFPQIPTYDSSRDGQEYAGFSEAAFNDHSYRFIRFRITFQLDSAQIFADELPRVNRLRLKYLSNL